MVRLLKTLKQVASIPILIIAKNRKYAQLFTSLFRIRKIHKTYLAIVYGKVNKSIKIMKDDLVYFENSKEFFIACFCFACMMFATWALRYIMIALPIILLLFFVQVVTFTNAFYVYEFEKYSDSSASYIWGYKEGGKWVIIPGENGKR